MVFANEDSGIIAGYTAQTDPERLDIDLGGGAVKGMVMGFTRDIRITKGRDYSTSIDENLPVSSLSFFAAPTQAINDTSVGFIHNGCAQDSDPLFYSFSTDASSTNAKGQQLLLSSTDQFVLMSFAVDPINDKVNLYLNGELHATSSLEATFGRHLHESLGVPSFKHANSFEYSGANVGASANELSGGPRLNLNFPCAIIGGGYTDGIAGKGFMGNTTYGPISGLRGHLGSIKFYNRAITVEEALKNYDAQKLVFENIQAPPTYTADGS